MPAAQILILTEQQKKNMTTGQKKRFLREMHFLASAEKLYILGQGEDVLENV